MQPDKSITSTMMAFESYLIRNRFSHESIRGYRCTVKKFLGQSTDADNSSHNDILKYLEGLNRKKLTKSTKQGKLIAIKKYFDFLVETGRREDHPCKTIYVKANSKRNVIHADLLSFAELESLLDREEKWRHVKVRNQVLISLLIYQGLMAGELASLKLSHIDLEAGTVYVNSGRVLTARTLPLLERQIELISDFISNHRPRCMIKGEIDFLIPNFQGTPYAVDGINSFIETMKPRFPEKNLNSKLIRDSVISYWLNVKKMPAEQVQLLAGHRWISSTLRYKRASISKEREIMNRFFPV